MVKKKTLVQLQLWTTNPTPGNINQLWDIHRDAIDAIVESMEHMTKQMKNRIDKAIYTKLTHQIKAGVQRSQTIIKETHEQNLKRAENYKVNRKVKHWCK